MKLKKLTKKLVLNKKTIVNLSHEEQRGLQGGTGDTHSRPNECHTLPEDTNCATLCVHSECWTVCGGPAC